MARMTLYLSDDTQKRLDLLVARWKVTRGQVIAEALELAASKKQRAK